MLEDDIAALLTLKAEEDVCAAFVKLVDQHGADAVQAWKEQKNKHRHRLIHIAASKNYADLLHIMVEQFGFDVNAQRDSDKCTPMHLAIFFRKPQSIEKLRDLRADMTLTNQYGESCDAKYEKFNASFKNIIWMDMEFSHGHYESLQNPQLVLEAAVIITDQDLNELGRGQWVVGGYSKEYLQGLGSWHQAAFCDAAPCGEFPPKEQEEAAGHGGNGLFSDILKSDKALEHVSSEIVELILQHCPDKACPLAGMSIQCDREVLKQQMPKVYEVLNHRIIDVSSFIGMAERWLPRKVDHYKADMKLNSNYNHRAVNDCEAAISAMRWIRKHLLVQPEILTG